MAWRVLGLCLACLATPAVAELQSLFPRQDGAAAPAAPASPFPGAEAGLFRAVVRQPAPAPPGREHTRIDRLLALIARAEAGPADYDAVQHGARVPPPRPPTDLTLGQIDAWIAATPGQPHAIGRYQFIPDTLRRLVRAEGLPRQTVFAPGVQDRLAMILLQEAGLADFRDGTLPRADFMHNLARIWAGLPLPDGRSYYEGHAGNSATMTWADFEGTMREIWPEAG
ncbi:hypothetical protein [Salibaculum halophilum]|uniref:hypothetical protein n=1 Tax=Salibaculum halophilum TaxID=1914408 RepID=UPI000A111B51|nr:hypothetical protein [Salibaculum halophilum]